MNYIGLIAVMFIGLEGIAQSASGSGSVTYKNALGIRAGGTSGFTYKRIGSGGSAFELIAGGWWNGFSVTGLFERYQGAGTAGLSWYYGGGAHIASYGGPSYYKDRYYYDRRYRYYYNRGEGDLAAGIDGIVGLEYKIKPIPVAISLDIKPFIEVNTFGGAYMALDPGLGVKFTF